MPDLLWAIKEAAVNAVEAGQPPAPLVGTVASVSPLSIRLEQRLTIGAEHLIVLRSASGLAAGAKVALLRFAGGQQFLVLGEILSGGLR